MRILWDPGGPPVGLGAMRRVRVCDVDMERLAVDLTVTNPAYWQQTMHGHEVTVEPTIELWKKAGDSVLVPRHYDVPWTARRPATVFDLRKNHDRGWRIKHAIKLRDHVQAEASEALRVGTDDKIISLACVAGDTVLNLNRGGAGFKITIAEAYSRQSSDHRYAWDRRIPTFTRAHLDDRIGLTEVLEIIYKGQRPTIELQLDSGRTLRLTEDHEVLTPVGFVPAGELDVRDAVIVDGSRATSIRKPKRAYERRGGFRHHPFARYQSRTWIIEKHRAVHEATMNGLTFREFRERCREGNVAGLTFLDPQRFHVHHKNENIYDNRPSNLEHWEVEKHLAHHRPGARAFGYGIPTVDHVRRIKIGRYEDVYDVMCIGPHHNFVANGIVVHNCGKGKTVVSLHAAAEGNRFPLLIVVNTNALMSQWRENYSREGELIGGIAKFYGLKPGDIGHVQAGTEKWKGYPVAIAMLHSLCMKKYSREFYEYWRLVIFDEVHRLGAGFFQSACSLFPCERWGLSATVKREDRMDKVFRMHLGRVVYKDLEQPLKPKTYFIPTGIQVNMNKFILRNGRLNMGKLYTVISEHPGRNKLIMKYIDKAYAKDRTILVLGERRTQLFDLCEEAKRRGYDASVHVGQGMDQEERSEALRHRIVFATQHLAKEGLDASALDTLFVLIPFGGKGRLQQSVGRILRIHPGKKDPEVLVFVDPISVSVALARRMRQGLAKMGFRSYDVKGGSGAGALSSPKPSARGVQPEEERSRVGHGQAFWRKMARR